MEHVVEMEKFVENSRTMLSDVLSKLGWTKSSICPKGASQKVLCPFDESHLISEKSLKKHVNKCKLTKEELLPQDFLPSSYFFYSHSPSVVPVMLDGNTCDRFKSKKESKKGLTIQQDHQAYAKSIQHGDDIDPSEVAFEEEHDGDQAASLESSVLMEHEDDEGPYGKIMSIYRWKSVPPPYHNLRLDVLNASEIKRWLVENLPDTQLLSSVTGADVQLVNYLWSCLNEASVSHPDGMVEQLKELLADKTRPFILKLWKFLAVSILAAKHGIGKAECERARKEAESVRKDTNSEGLYTAPGESCCPGGLGVSKSMERTELASEIPKPMDRVRSEFTPQERLAIYEHVVQVSKAAKEQSAITLSELAKDLETAESAENATEGPAKSHVEVLAEMRDYKRRRQSYRAKNVHITKRSATDVMRDLIETQMKTLLPEEDDAEQGSSVITEEKGGRDERRQSNYDRDRHEEKSRHRQRDERRYGTSHLHHTDRHRHRRRSRDRDPGRVRHRGRQRDTDRSRRESGNRHRSRSNERSESEELSRLRDSRCEKQLCDREKESQREKERAGSPSRNENEVEAIRIKPRARIRERSRESGERSSSSSEGDGGGEAGHRGRKRRKHKHKHYKKERRKEDRYSLEMKDEVQNA